MDILSKEYRDLTPILSTHFNYDNSSQKFHIKQNSSFKSHIDVRLRVKYFIISYMKRKAYQDIYPTFDEIVLHIMPLLKNGITPEEQTILNVLETIAMRMHSGHWKLQMRTQLSLL